jgi:hypothetical protein
VRTLRSAITDHGRPTAVLISPEEFARLEARELAREIAEAKAASAGKRPVVVGDITVMSFEEFDAVVADRADHADHADRADRADDA